MNNNPIDKGPILPVEVAIAVAVNLAAAFFAYYVMMLWGT
jgi:hypothetical protein